MDIDRTSLDLTIIKNRDFVMNVYLRNADNAPIDVTTWSGVGEIRETSSPESKLILTFTVSVINGPTGKIEVFVSKVNTAVCQDAGYWDLVLTNANNRSDSYAMGNVIFILAPTKI